MDSGCNTSPQHISRCFLWCGNSQDQIYALLFQKSTSLVNKDTFKHLHPLSLFLLLGSVVCDQTHLKQNAHKEYYLFFSQSHHNHSHRLPLLCSVHISGKTVLKGSDNWEPVFKYFTTFAHACMPQRPIDDALKFVPYTGTGGTPTQEQWWAANSPLPASHFHVAAGCREEDGVGGRPSRFLWPYGLFPFQCEWMHISIKEDKHLKLIHKHTQGLIPSIHPKPLSTKLYRPREMSMFIHVNNCTCWPLAFVESVEETHWVLGAHLALMMGSF